MSTNYERGDGPTEPLRGANQTEPIRDSTADDPTNSTQPGRRPRVGTVVWGLIIIALASILILAEVATISLDFGQVMIGLLIGAGLALVIGGLISAKNREKDDKQP
ncbi:hypothetical protein [Arthrobacter sp. H14]|uniref:hypothetical protein n=1 Tax=Arthrobacter sp. H14 TaxID=1312959 RepID=UPI00047CEB69|nr:hypothetical protein [Arthrobacter sp. H14]